MAVRPFVVRRVSRETQDSFTMEMAPRDGGRDFAFLPGQFNMLYVFGVGEVPISISGDPAKTETLVHTTRAVGTVTKALCRMVPGDTVGVRGPYGSSWPVEKAEGSDVLIVAGGIGLAPLRSVVYHLQTHREKYGKVALLYGARAPEEMLYRKEVEYWRTHYDMEIHMTVDRATTGSWRGNVGVVTTIIPNSPCDHTHCLVVICGPEIMMRFTVLELQKRGMTPEQIYISMERNMKCGIGLCGHCQIGSSFVCKDGPVYRFADVKDIFTKREL